MARKIKRDKRPKPENEVELQEVKTTEAVSEQDNLDTIRTLDTTYITESDSS